MLGPSLYGPAYVCESTILGLLEWSTLQGFEAARVGCAAALDLSDGVQASDVKAILGGKSGVNLKVR